MNEFDLVALRAHDLARTAVERVKGEINEKRSKLTLAKPTDEQGAMSTEQRDTFLKQNRHNPVVAAAVAHASIPALVGVDEMVHRNIISEQIKREHGDVLAEISDLEEVVGVVDRLTGLARNELHHIIGCSSEIFADLARVGEAGNGELPFRIEQRQIDGETKEICRVYDMAAKTWRDASPDEIQKVAA